MQKYVMGPVEVIAEHAVCVTVGTEKQHSDGYDLKYPTQLRKRDN